MSLVASKSTALGLDNVLDEWTGLPSIKERKAAASMSMVKHLECRCNAVVLVVLVDVHVLRQD